ncbi:MAG: HD-GYP domain-containing protein [Gammaproteobacteria bacterium]|nr:HD-GYP domain-containing protein [Gammaproteobacteria bacterium]
MIKRIDSQLLQPGMYVHDLDIPWVDHGFAQQHFLVVDSATISRIISQGIHRLYIDTSKGRDLAPEAATKGEPQQEVHARIDATISELSQETPPRRQRTVQEEISTARKICSDANAIVSQMMTMIRLGERIDAHQLEGIVNRIYRSVSRNPYALSGVSRIKIIDRYASMHCVSVASLAAAFANYLGVDEGTVREITKGALLHDIGTAMIPDEILMKSTPPSDDEFRLLRGHVQLSISIIKKTMGVSAEMATFVSRHHERCDGSGYPEGLTGDQIGKVGQMAAIIDVYDALTSPRGYRQAWPPTRALKKQLEWSPDHFNQELMRLFIRMQGIFPIGTVVEMSSGLVGVVVDQGKKLNAPVVKIFYNALESHFEPVRELDMSSSDEDQIRYAISPERYRIDPKVVVSLYE